jgi:hypothetical protein
MRITEATIRVFSTLMRIAFVLYPDRLSILREPEFKFQLITVATYVKPSLIGKIIFRSRIL